MRTTSNIGISGVESIRIGEMKICDLPIAESAIAKQQIPLAEDVERQNKIADILVGYPKQGVNYLTSRIRECEENITKIGQMKNDQSKMISEYTAQITLCKFRDSEIEAIDDLDLDKPFKVKELFKKFPPYQVPAMEQQIIQSNEAIERADGVIATEFNSIAEMRELKGLCQQRDMKLRYLNAKVAMD